MTMQSIAPFARPFYLMAKPVGAVCNLACDYCYYLEKSNMYASAPRRVMSDELLEDFIRKYIGAQTSPHVLFTWHGGEPLMRPLSFYRRAVELQRKYAAGRVVENSLQTNGTLLTDEWCRFFRDNNWLIGISIDGPEKWHDACRRTRSGKPSFANVMRGIDLLNKHGVEWNAMAVANSTNADHPEEFYDFFRGIGCQYLQFTPVVERITTHADGRHLAAVEDEARLAPFSITPGAWGRFLCGVFDRWVRQDVGRLFVQLFDATLANWVGEQPGLCSMAKVCGHAAAIEHNGDVYSCDHYVFPQYRLGNISRDSLIDMMYGEKQTRFGLDKQARLTRQCRECSYLFACNGECPKNRFALSIHREPGQNYLCAGYYRFFAHAAPYMDFMKNELLHGRPPANVMYADIYAVKAY